MANPVEAMQRFNDVLRDSVEFSTRALGAAFAAQHGSHVASMEWDVDRYGNTAITVTLTDGHSIIGRGPAKLEAIVDANNQLGPVRT